MYWQHLLLKISANFSVCVSLPLTPQQVTLQSHLPYSLVTAGFSRCTTLDSCSHILQLQDFSKSCYIKGKSQRNTLMVIGAVNSGLACIPIFFLFISRTSQIFVSTILTSIKSNDTFTCYHFQLWEPNSHGDRWYFLKKTLKM